VIGSDWPSVTWRMIRSSPMNRLPSVMCRSGGGDVKAEAGVLAAGAACVGASSGNRSIAASSRAARSPVPVTL